MSEFFNSDIVREELQEINELQMSIYENAMKFGTFSRDDKVDHIERLTELLERQKVMYTRISLSNDPEAVDLKNHLQKSVELMGFPEGTDMLLLFSGMSNTIDNLKKSIDT
jgi:phosphopantetheine adenylyltransferase|tara:strand:- start:80 stop:412 length:333 start_codon:yes stop_codon:yes gene_type:complete